MKAINFIVNFVLEACIMAFLAAISASITYFVFNTLSWKDAFSIIFPSFFVLNIAMNAWSDLNKKIQD